MRVLGSISITVSATPLYEDEDQARRTAAARGHSERGKARIMVVASPRTFCWVSSSARCGLTASHESTACIDISAWLHACMHVGFPDCSQPAHSYQVRCGLCSQPHPRQHVWELAGPTAESCPLPRIFKQPPGASDFRRSSVLAARGSAAFR